MFSSEMRILGWQGDYNIVVYLESLIATTSSMYIIKGKVCPLVVLCSCIIGMSCL